MRKPTMPPHANNVISIRPEPPTLDPPDYLVQRALHAFIRKDLADFACSLETAREMWSKFPELVVAPVIPEQLRAAYVEEWGHEPDGSCESAGIDVFEPGHREKQLPHAIEVARGWMQQERSESQRAERADDFDDWAETFLAENQRETWGTAISTAAVPPLAAAALLRSDEPQTRRGAGVTAVAAIAALLRR
jgi:hypothetical protein